MKQKRFNWYTCKVQVTRPTEGNELKEVTESYVIDAVNFTDAETKVVQLFNSETLPFEIKRIVKSNYEGVLNSDDRCETYFKVKVVSKILNENGKEKATNHFFIVKDSYLVGAINKVERDVLVGWLVDTEVVAATITDIVDVITE